MPRNRKVHNQKYRVLPRTEKPCFLRTPGADWEATRATLSFLQVPDYKRKAQPKPDDFDYGQRPPYNPDYAPTPVFDPDEERYRCMGRILQNKYGK